MPANGNEMIKPGDNVNVLVLVPGIGGHS